LNTKVDILAVGDSFTVGLGVEAKEAWPSQLESSLKSGSAFPTATKVVNAGVSAYSVTQIRMFLQELLILDPSIVVLGLYPAAYWRITNPYVYLNGGVVLRSEVPQLRAVDGGFIRSPIYNRRLKKLYFWFANNFYLGAYALQEMSQLRGGSNRFANAAPLQQETPVVEDRLALLLREVALTDQHLRDRGITFVVLLVNSQEPDGSFTDLDKQYNAVVKDYCHANKIPVFDPLPFFESSASESPIFRIGKDHHWSKEAHALVGRHLGEFLEQQNLLRPRQAR